MIPEGLIIKKLPAPVKQQDLVTRTVAEVQQESLPSDWFPNLQGRIQDEATKEALQRLREDTLRLAQQIQDVKGKPMMTVTSEGSQKPSGNEAVTLPLLTVDQNNYNLGLGTFFRLGTDGGKYSLTGLAFNGSVASVRLVNVAGDTIHLQNENAGSAESNRIITGTGADFDLEVDAPWVLLQYDTWSKRWRM